jgi:hypothetical protein
MKLVRERVIWHFGQVFGLAMAAKAVEQLPS